MPVNNKDFSLSFEDKGGYAIIRIMGCLDKETSDILVYRLLDLEGQRKDVLIDINSMTGYDQDGRRILLSWTARVRNSGNRLVLIETNHLRGGNIASSLRITGFEFNFEFANNVEEAVERISTRDFSLI